MGAIANIDPTLGTDDSNPNTNFDDNFDDNLEFINYEKNNVLIDDYDNHNHHLIYNNTKVNSAQNVVRKKIDYVQLSFGFILILFFLFGLIETGSKYKGLNEKTSQEIIVTEKVLNRTIIDILCFNKLTNTEYKCYNTTYNIGYLVNNSVPIITNSSYFVCTDINTDCILAYDKIINKLQTVYYFDDNVHDYNYESKRDGKSKNLRLLAGEVLASLMGIIVSFLLVGDSINK